MRGHHARWRAPAPALLPPLLLALALAGCGAREAPGASPPPAPQPMAGGASCPLGGRVPTRGGDALFFAARGGAAVALFTGREVDLALTEIAVGSERRARATVDAGGVVLSGWIAPDAATFYARQDVPLVAGHVWIPEGARVRVLAGQGAALRIEAVYTDFEELTADVGCGAVGLTPSPRAAPDAAPSGRYAHLRRDAVPLFAEPGGPAVRVLRSHREGPTVQVSEARAGMSLVTYGHGVRLSGWLRDEDLDPGEGPDCDHCYGGGDIPDVWDTCPDAPDSDGFEDIDGCPDRDPPPKRVASAGRARIRLSPAADAEPIGHVERGAEVYVVEQRDGWGRIQVKGYAVAPPHGHGFWVELAELLGAEPRP